MRRVLSIAFCFAIMHFASSALPCFAQMKREPIPQEAHDQARRALPELLRQTVNPETYKRLGFVSVEEAQKAELGEPTRIYMVQLEQLRDYSTSKDPAQLLTETNQVRYPVLVGNEVKLSLVMQQIEGKWQVAKFGRPLLTRNLVETMRKSVGSGVKDDAFEVNVPALGLYFAGNERGNGLVLTPVNDDPRFELRQGESREAQQIFSRLSAYARQLKTGPYLSD